MDGAVLTALIAACSALGGAAVAHWGAWRLQAQRLEREAERERSARRRQQRAECLGWVLETRSRMEALLPLLRGETVSPVSSDKTALAAARQAYAVALLSLVAARPAAKAFYQSSARLQLALYKPIAEDGGEIPALSSTWHADYAAFEALLASLTDDA